MNVAVEVASIRNRVWAKLREVAYPDSRFHLDFSEYIPDFDGSQAALTRLVAQPFYQDAKYVFIAPDNCLTSLRERALLDEKRIIVSTHGIRRGLIMITRDMVPMGEERFSSWLDGLEYYGEPIRLSELKRYGQFDLLVTGASAVSRNGIRFGKGHGYFDIEWGLLREINAVHDETVVATVIHDVQLVDDSLVPSQTDTIVDYVITPTVVIETIRTNPRPKGIYWNLLPPGMLAIIPPLRELRTMKKANNC